MTTATPSVEYQAAAALAAVLRVMPEPGSPAWPEALTPLAYQDWVANTVVFTVNGMVFHAVVTAA